MDENRKPSLAERKKWFREAMQGAARQRLWLRASRSLYGMDESGYIYATIEYAHFRGQAKRIAQESGWLSEWYCPTCWDVAPVSRREGRARCFLDKGHEGDHFGHAYRVGMRMWPRKES